MKWENFEYTEVFGFFLTLDVKVILHSVKITLNLKHIVWQHSNINFKNLHRICWMKNHNHPERLSSKDIQKCPTTTCKVKYVKRRESSACMRRVATAPTSRLKRSKVSFHPDVATSQLLHKLNTISYIYLPVRKL